MAGASGVRGSAASPTESQRCPPDEVAHNWPLAVPEEVGRGHRDLGAQGAAGPVQAQPIWAFRKSNAWSGSPWGTGKACHERPSSVVRHKAMEPTATATVGDTA